DKTRDPSSEIGAALSFDATDQLTLSAEMTYDLQARTTGKKLGLDYGLTDALTLSTEIGQPDQTASRYYAAGVSYDFAENSGVTLQYQKTKSDSGRFALLIAYRFGPHGE
ncbi:MAG: hypothetical protein EBU97_04035, partial [Rhodobacteraceae bacterium]|nr:hypothetical protein [Paracoccaceae bacterium]